MNEITIKITFTDADMDRVDRLARLAGWTTDQLLAKILNPGQLSKHIKTVIDALEKSYGDLERMQRNVDAAKLAGNVLLNRKRQ